MRITTVRRWHVQLKLLVRLMLVLVLALPIVWHGLPYFHRPLLQARQFEIAPGASYQRFVLRQPRPVVMHIAKVNLTQPGLQLFVTPGRIEGEGHSLKAKTTTEFLTRYQQQLAINASFFYPFSEDAPWDYYPQSGQRVHAIGYAASNGQVYTDGRYVTNWSVACWTAQNRMEILRQPNCPPNTWQGLSGNQLLLLNGHPQVVSDKDKPYSRTIVGTDSSGQTLWLIVIDGKQPWYSEGMTIAEIIPFLQQQGIHAALNLDGGGSVTMAMATQQGLELLNAPIHNKIPMRQRPVANHLGLRWEASRVKNSVGVEKQS